MKNEVKFQKVKLDLLTEEGKKLEKEAREKFGDAVVEEVNEKLRAMSLGDWQKSDDLNLAFEQALLEALASNDPGSAIAQKACDLHRLWLCTFWKEEFYSYAKHLALGKMYLEDPRFQKAYETIDPSAAEFLWAALQIYCQGK